jgi:ribonuclease BN (tRNA processing enzyme)
MMEIPARGGHVVLLGTSGGPIPVRGRCMAASAVIVDGSAYLVDCGGGAVRRLTEAGISYRTLKALFITHLHADHVTDYFALVTAGKPFFENQGFAQPFRVIGPGPADALPAKGANDRRPARPDAPTSGTEDLHRGVIDAYAYTMNIQYILTPLGPDFRDLVCVDDIVLPPSPASARGPLAPPMSPIEVYADDNVRVSAILVEHPPVFPAFAFRFDTPYGSVVFSGDTVPTENLTRLARGADVVVHEAMCGAAMLNAGVPEHVVALLIGGHTDVTQVGEVAVEAETPHLVLSHLVPPDPSSFQEPVIDPRLWVAPIRSAYDGRVAVGRDLLRLPL